MLTMLALVFACYCMVVSFRELMRARAQRAVPPWARIGGHAMVAVVCFAAAIFVLPAVEGSWRTTTTPDTEAPSINPAQSFPAYGTIRLVQDEWDVRLDGAWYCSGTRLETIRFETQRFEETLKPGYEGGPAASGTATLWKDSGNNLLLKLVSDDNPIDLYSASIADGEPALLPPSSEAWFFVEFYSDNVVSLKHLNYPFQQSIDMFVNAGIALFRGSPDQESEARRQFEQLSEHVMSFASDGRMPIDASGIIATSGATGEAAQRDALAMTGYWLPKLLKMEGVEAQSASVYRFFFQEGIFYQWTSSPYDFQASYYVLRPDKEPAEFDFHFEIGARSERLLGIYKVSGSELSMCWSRTKRPTEFKSTAEDGNKLMVLERLTR